MFAKFRKLLKSKVYKWIFTCLLILVSPFLIVMCVLFWPIMIASSLFVYFRKYTLKFNKLIVTALVFATLGVQVWL